MCVADQCQINACLIPVIAQIDRRSWNDELPSHGLEYPLLLLYVLLNWAIPKTFPYASYHVCIYYSYACINLHGTKCSTWRAFIASTVRGECTQDGCPHKWENNVAVDCRTFKFGPASCLTACFKNRGPLESRPFLPLAAHQSRKKG